MSRSIVTTVLTPSLASALRDMYAGRPGLRQLPLRSTIGTSQTLLDGTGAAGAALIEIMMAGGARD
jgi:hypothetical protein